MSDKKRIFVEKRGIFDVESPKIFSEIKTIVPHIQDVKVYNIYDLFGIEENELNKVIFNTFVDPVVDILHTENPAKDLHFATEFLPGQYDQRAERTRRLGLRDRCRRRYLALPRRSQRSHGHRHRQRGQRHEPPRRRELRL